MSGLPRRGGLNSNQTEPTGVKMRRMTTLAMAAAAVLAMSAFAQADTWRSPSIVTSPQIVVDQPVLDMTAFATPLNSPMLKNGNELAAMKDLSAYDGITLVLYNTDGAKVTPALKPTIPAPNWLGQTISWVFEYDKAKEDGGIAKHNVYAASVRGPNYGTTWQDLGSGGAAADVFGAS